MVARHRWAQCPGSVREAAKYPSRAPGPSAIDGTHTHTVLNRCVEAGLADPRKMVGVVLEDHDGQFVVDAERAVRAKVAIDYVIERVASFGGLATVQGEQKVSLRRMTGRDDMDGTYDIVITGGRTLEVCDYKDGMNIVPAEENLQLEQYAFGELGKYGVTPETIPFDEVRMTIIQPKAAYKGANPISTWTLSVREMLEYRISKLVMQGQACDQPDAPLVPGDSQCMWCPAKGGCAAFAAQASASIGLMFKPIVENPAMTDLVQQAQAQAQADPAVMSSEQLIQILEAAPLVRQMLSAAEAEAERRLRAGIPVPGYKLVEGRGSRKWALPEDEIAKKLTAMSVPKGEVYEQSVLSPAKVEKLTWKNKSGEPKALSKRQLATIDKDYVSHLTGKLTLVPESDSRPGIATNAAGMFGPVGEQPAASPPVEQLPDWLS